MNIKGIDHLVVTVSDLKQSIEFYCNVLGLELDGVDEAGTLATLRAGSQLIRLQTPKRAGALIAEVPAPGSCDFCLETASSPAKIIADLAEHGIDPVAGPVKRHGACGEMQSVYVRDPDGSLIELANYSQ